MKYEFKESKNIYGDLIFETKLWRLFLTPSQICLGTCILALKRSITNLKDLNSEEWKEFSLIVKDLEIAIEKAFNPDLYTWACYKNASYRDKNVNAQVHWHFHPRYRNPIIFEGFKFEDKTFGFPISLKEKTIPNEIRKKIIKHIQNKLSF
jgi:diadenosine tetraphosphate (Ap4A) HIT family hydrolase